MHRNLSHPVDAPLLVPKSLKRTSFCNLDNFSQSGQMQFLQPAQKNLCDPPKSVAKSLPTPFFATLFPDRQLNGLLVTRILLRKIYFLFQIMSWYSSGKNVFLYIFCASSLLYTNYTNCTLWADVYNWCPSSRATEGIIFKHEKHLSWIQILNWLNSERTIISCK